MWAADIFVLKILGRFLRLVPAGLPVRPLRLAACFCIRLSTIKCEIDPSSSDARRACSRIRVRRACYPMTIGMALFSRSSAFSRVTALAAQRAVHGAFGWLHNNPKTLMDCQAELVAIPAPPFGEEARSKWLDRKSTRLNS